MQLKLFTATLSFLRFAQASQHILDETPEADVKLATEHVHSDSCIHSQDKPVIQSDLWDEPVKCIPKANSTETYCVYTDTRFAKGRGISFFTTPSIAESISGLPAFTKKNAHKHANKLSEQWEVRDIEGRGRGVVATEKLHRGDKIMASTPLGVYHTDALQTDSKLDYIYLHTAFIQLPKESQEVYLSSMTGDSAGDPIMERLNVNAHTSEFEGAPHFLMYPEIAKMNHACRPNAMHYFDPKTLVHSTAAARTIEIGEEITLPYIPILQPRAERQKALSEYWGFTCSCSLCSAPPSSLAASSTRLERILELQTELAVYNWWSTATPVMAEELIALYAEEELWAAKEIGHTFAALAYNAVGDTKVAVWHAEFALDARMENIADDDDSESMKALLADPVAHWSYRVRLPKEKVLEERKDEL